MKARHSSRKRVGLHHLCFRARERADIDELHGFLQKLGAKIIRAPREDQWAPGYYSILFEDPDGIRLELNHVPGRGCWGSVVEWVERSEPITHSAMIDGFRCALPILRTGCATLFAANRTRIKIQLLSSCHALLGSEHCSRAPLSQEIES